MRCHPPLLPHHHITRLSHLTWLVSAGGATGGGRPSPFGVEWDLAAEEPRVTGVAVSSADRSWELLTERLSRAALLEERC